MKGRKGEGEKGRRGDLATGRWGDLATGQGLFSDKVIGDFASLREGERVNG